MRNYQKRVVREIVSKRLNLITNKNILIVIKKTCLDINYHEKEKMLEKLLIKVNK